MLVAFQGFTAPPGGKKTVAGMENVFVGEYIIVSEIFPRSLSTATTHTLTRTSRSVEF
jgi:hypothetical protein